MIRLLLCISAVILSYVPLTIYAKENIMSLSAAKKVPYSFEIHGQKIEDEYHWLRGENWPERITDKEILSYLTEENDYFDRFMNPLADEKNIIFEELKGRVKLKDQSTYIQKDDYYYYTRTQEDKDYTIYCRNRGLNSQEEILLDVNHLAQGKKFISIGSFSVSPNHKLLAYSVDFSGGEKFTIKIFDLQKQQFLNDEIENTIGSIVWHEDGQGFFYTPIDENWRHDKVMFHKLGASNKLDKLLFHEPNPLYSVMVSKSVSRKYVFIEAKGHDSNEIYYFPMDDYSFSPILIKPRADKVLYSIDHGGEYFYLYTNENAKNFKILRSRNPKKNVIDGAEATFASNAATGYDGLALADKVWQEYIEEEKDRYLSGFDLNAEYLLLNYKHNGLPLIKVERLSDRSAKIVKFPDESYTATAYSTNFDLNDIRINYSSLVTPSTVFEYKFHTEKLDILKVQEIPSGFNSDEYVTRRVFAKSGDAKIPISLLYKKSLFKGDGSNPLYLYGYGSYGIGMSPAFRNSAISLVNRGFVFGVAHIRGGDDLGYEWYEAAKFLNKKRTFDDFIASAESLIEKKYTSKGNIAIMGGSAGGMLIGAVINQRPDLFKAAIAHVPFVDVLNTMLDETLPLTPSEFKEWGNPKEKEYFDYIKSYSPYDNVEAKNYPHLMVTAGLTDPRVGYWEAAKWVARLRDKKTDNNTIIFKTNMDFGHSGASARFEYLKEAADDIVFILEVFGLKQAQNVP